MLHKFCLAPCLLLTLLCACGTSAAGDWTTIKPEGLDEAARPIETLSLSEDGHRVAWAANGGGKSPHGYLGIVDTVTKSTVFHLKLDTEIQDVALDPSGKKIYVAAPGLRCLDDTGKLLWEAPKIPKVSALATTGDGKLFAGTARQIFRVNPADGTIEKTYTSDDPKIRIMYFMLSPDGTTVLVWKVDMSARASDLKVHYGTACLLDGRTLEVKSTIDFASLNCPGRPEAFSSDGKKMICAGDEYDKLVVADIAAKKIIPLDARMFGIVAGPTPAFSDDGTCVMVPCSKEGSGTDAYSILFFDAGTGKQIAVMSDLPQHLFINASAVRKNMAVVSLNNPRDNSVATTLSWCDISRKVKH